MDAAVMPLATLSMVVASPNRSATPQLLIRFVLAFGAVCGLVCTISFFQGNVLAPLFGLVDVVVVALVLRHVWRLGDAADQVSWDGSSIRVSRRRGRSCSEMQFQPYWVRLERHPGPRQGDPERLVLTSHGRRVEIGSFLSGERRQAFAREVAALLARARDVD